jgi:hypothetical protein
LLLRFAEVPRDDVFAGMDGYDAAEGGTQEEKVRSSEWIYAEEDVVGPNCGKGMTGKGTTSSGAEKRLPKMEPPLVAEGGILEDGLLHLQSKVPQAAQNCSYMPFSHHCPKVSPAETFLPNV